MNKKKIFIAVWAVASAGLFYFYKDSPRKQKPEVVKEEAPAKEPVRLTGVEGAEELPLKLKSRIDDVLARIEGMWDPTGRKLKEVGEKMESLEKALEENKPELAEKILSEIEIIVSEK